jgi:hypothetical protein
MPSSKGRPRHVVETSISFMNKLVATVYTKNRKYKANIQSLTQWFHDKPNNKQFLNQLKTSDLKEKNISIQQITTHSKFKSSFRL